MKFSLSIVLVGLGVMLSATNSKAQTIDNSCAYSFSWGSGYDYFSFCVTNYGTLAKLESPKGVNHLDTANPIEGYAWCDFDDYGRSMGNQTYIPGLGLDNLCRYRSPTARASFLSSLETSVQICP